MAIRPQEFENPERDLDLTTRGPEVAAEEPEDPEPEPEEPDAGLVARVAAARALAPPDVACRACWVHGRDAAADAVALAGGLAVARGLEPNGSGLHWRVCWLQGRDAALAVIEGRQP